MSRNPQPAGVRGSMEATHPVMDVVRELNPADRSQGSEHVQTVFGVSSLDVCEYGSRGLQVHDLVVQLRLSGADVKRFPPPPCWDPNNRGTTGRICWATAAAAWLPAACSPLDVHTHALTATPTPHSILISLH